MPFLRKKHYNSSERYFLDLYFRRMPYNPIRWLFPGTLHPRDSSIREVLSLALCSFARTENRQHRPIHPELMIRLFHSGLLHGVTASHPPETFLGLPPTFNTGQNSLSIQTDPRTKKCHRRKVMTKSDRESVLQGYMRTIQPIIPGFEDNNEEVRLAVEEYEENKRLENATPSELKKVPKKIPKKIIKKPIKKKSKNPPLPRPSWHRPVEGLPASCFRLGESNTIYDFSLPNKPYVPKIKLPEDRVEKLVRQMLGPEPTQPPENRPEEERPNSEVHLPQVPSSPPIQYRKSSGKVVKLKELSPLNTDPEADREFIRRISEGYNPERRLDPDPTGHRFKQKKKIEKKPPSKVRIGIDQLPSYFRFRLNQNPEQNIMLGELGIGVRGGDWDEVKLQAGIRRRAAYMRQNLLKRGCRIPAEVKRELSDLIRDSTRKLKKMGAVPPPLYQKATAPSLAQLYLEEYNGQRAYNRTPTPAPAPALVELEEVSSEEDQEMFSVPETSEISPNVSKYHRKFDRVSSDEEL